MIQTVLLDLDGTLLDSNDAHAKSWVEALAQESFHVEYEEIRKRIGMGGDHILPQLIGFSEDSDVGQRISKARGEIFRGKYLPHLKPFAGARSLLEKMIEHHLELIVATSASEEDLKVLLKQIGIEDLIEKATSSADVENSKPSPDIISAALKKSSSNPQEAVMLGDTPYDIKAAARAGVRTIAFTCGGWDNQALKDAIAIYEGPWQLLEEFEESALCGNLAKQVHAHSQNASQGLQT